VAVEQGPEGAYVFVPDAQGKARQVPVVVDRTTADLAVIAKGLSAGDRVVVDGQSRLFPGAPMRIARTVEARQPQAVAAGAAAAAAPAAGSN
jgi:hypothetical protein